MIVHLKRSSYTYIALHLVIRDENGPKEKQQKYPKHYTHSTQASAQKEKLLRTCR